MIQLYILLQTHAPADGGQAGFWIIIILLFIIIWALKIRPQSKKKVEQEQIGKQFIEQNKNMDSPKSSSQRTVKDKLYELKQLLDEGAITQEEFDKAKAKLIDEI